MATKLSTTFRRVATPKLADPEAERVRIELQQAVNDIQDRVSALITALQTAGVI